MFFRLLKNAFEPPSDEFENGQLRHLFLEFSDYHYFHFSYFFGNKITGIKWAWSLNSIAELSR